MKQIKRRHFSSCFSPLNRFHRFLDVNRHNVQRSIHGYYSCFAIFILYFAIVY